MEEKVARQRTEIEETKRERDKLYYDLHDVKEQKLQLEVTVSRHYVPEFKCSVENC
jgi:hypothetical protein